MKVIPYRMCIIVVCHQIRAKASFFLRDCDIDVVTKLAAEMAAGYLVWPL